MFSRPKRYNDGLWDLLHDPRYFDTRVIVKIPSSDYTSELIYVCLRKLGFQDQCLVISTNWEIDGRTLPTLEALEIIGGTDTMLFCTVSKIGYYEGHEGWRYLLSSAKSK